MEGLRWKRILKLFRKSLIVFIIKCWKKKESVICAKQKFESVKEDTLKGFIG
jgi:hypothetical protein